MFGAVRLGLGHEGDDRFQAKVQAEAEFKTVLKQDARQPMARRGLRTLQEHQEQQKRGLFKRMFR